MSLSPSYYSNFELVEDNTEYEYRTDYVYILGGVNLGILRYPKRRQIRSKTYEGTIEDLNSPENEIPAPSYLAGSSSLKPNPENLSEGTGYGQWQCDNVTYTKGLSAPLSRVIRVTWVTKGQWEDLPAETNS